MNPGTNPNDDFGPILDGISIPDTIILPPEVVQLLPWMSLAELKVVIAAIARLMQVGAGEPITLSEFQQMTGLDRKSVLSGIERAMRRGLLIRYEITGYRGHTMHVYELKPRFIGGKTPNFIGGIFPPIAPVKAKQSKDDDVVNLDSESTTSFALLDLSAGAKNSQKSPENASKNGLFLRLRKVGIYTKTAQFLLEHYPPERIEKFLEIYPLAVRVGRADGVGWLVKAISDPTWDPDLEREDLEQRQAQHDGEPEGHEPEPRVNSKHPALPKRVLDALREIGWNGNTAELEGYYRANRRQFNAWLAWAKQQPCEYAAARLLNGLRSGISAPKAQGDGDPHRYLEGPYGEFIQH